MAVVTTGEELFINAAWTTAKKVPAKSPFGVPLTLGENAFATLDEAIAYAEEHSLTMVKYIDGDKAVAVSDADGKVTYISSKEIKGTETVKTTKTGATYTAQSKQSAANKITVDNSGAPETTVAGFKEVTLNGGTAEFIVQGGNNTVTHVYAVNSTTKESTVKDSGTISGKADGTLTVRGANVALAGGAWAEVQTNDENKDEITTSAAAFKMAVPGDPASIDWGESDVSALAYLPGYATVTLTGGASAAVLLGGTFDFTHATDAVYTVAGETDYLSSLNKTLKYTRKNSGKLTVTDSVVNDATGYATVAVTGASADFGGLDNTGGSLTVKTTYKKTRSAKNTTVKTTTEQTENSAANGTLTVEGIGFGGETARDVAGFAKVTVKDARLGDLSAVGGKYSVTASTETVTTPIAGGSSVKVTISETVSENATAGGTLTTAKGSTKAEFGDIDGFSKVELANATVDGDIEIAGGRPGSYSQTTTTTTVGEVLMQSKITRKEEYAAAGTVTMSGGSVSGDIEGAATVKLTGIAVGGDIRGGGTVKVNYSDELSLNSKTKALTSSYSSSMATQLKGTVTMSGGAVAGSDGIIGYQTVTLDGTAVEGSINDYDSYLTLSSSYKHEYSDSGVTLTKQNWSSGYSYAPTAALTLKNGATVAGSAYGIKTLTLTSGAAISCDVDMENDKEQTTDTITSKGGIYTETYQRSKNESAIGTVTATNAVIGAELWGAGKVTATDTTLGDIYGATSSVTRKSTLTGSAVEVDDEDDSGYYYIAEDSVISENYSRVDSVNAAGNATLTRTTAGELVGVATVKLTGGSVEGADAGNSKYITSNVSSATVSNAISSDTWGTVGTFTATSGAAVAGDILGYSTITLDQTKAMGNVGGVYDIYRYGSKNVSSSLKQTFDKNGALQTQNFASASSYAPTVALTLKNGAFVAGDAYGIKTLNIGGGATIGGNVYMDNYARKESENLTSNKKTGLYEQNKQYTSSQGVAGTVTLTGISGGANQLCGDICGAAKVTATDAVIGSLINSCTIQSYTTIRKGNTLSSWNQSRYIANPSEWDLADSSVRNASGNATLTRTSAGLIFNFATVKLTDGEIAGAFAGTSKVFSSTTLKNGVYTHSCTSNSGVLGTFTATSAKITDALTRFATVNLTGCYLTEADSVIMGGSTTVTMSGTGATQIEAENNASATATTTFTAAGTLTAKNTEMGGYAVKNYATVNLTDCGVKSVVVDDGNTAKTALTLAGFNYFGGAEDFLIDGYASVTVKGGFTLLEGGLRGTAGKDTVTVNAKSELAVEGGMFFGAEADSFTVNGTARVGGDFDAANLEKLSGSGLLALGDAGAAALRASIDAGTTKLSGKLEIVAAGREPDDVLAVRTKQEELADNTAATARKLEGIEMNGWLSGVEDAAAYKFADTEDWFNFAVVNDEVFQVEMTDATRHEDLKVELWQGGAKVQDIAWDDMTERFEIAGLAAGDYQLKLSVENDTSALSYVFGLKQLG